MQDKFFAQSGKCVEFMCSIRGGIHVFDIRGRGDGGSTYDGGV